MKLKLTLSLIGTLLLAPMALHAQNASADKADPQPKAPQARIDAAMQAAARAKVPLSLLESKLAEGEAKGVPQERIAAAVEARANALIKAADVMSKTGIKAVTEGELAVAGDALQAGVSERALIEISRSAPAERRAVAVAVLTDLVRTGEKPEPALARVQAAVTSNVALANLHAEVAAKLRLGGLTSTLDAGGIVRLH